MLKSELYVVLIAKCSKLGHDLIFSTLSKTYSCVLSTSRHLTNTNIRFTFDVRCLPWVSNILWQRTHLYLWVCSLPTSGKLGISGILTA